MIGNIIVGTVIVFILALAVIKITDEKKKGKKCIGCPYSDGCESCPSDEQNSVH